jgi:hypothetical protein
MEREDCEDKRNEDVRDSDEGRDDGSEWRWL